MMYLQGRSVYDCVHALLGDITQNDLEGLPIGEDLLSENLVPESIVACPQ
jgi:hypothetical protein